MNVQQRSQRSISNWAYNGHEGYQGCAHETESIPLTEYFPFLAMTPFGVICKPNMSLFYAAPDSPSPEGTLSSMRCKTGYGIAPLG